MGKQPEWEHVPTGWERPDAWSSDSVIAAYRDKLPRFRRAVAAPNPLGVPTEALLGVEPAVYEQNVMLEYVFAVTLAARRRHEISVLDWGGGFAFLSFVADSVLPSVALDYHVKELPRIADAGRELVPEVRFWDDDTCLARTYDLIVISSALQYTEDWRDALRRFARATPDGRVLVMRTPFVLEHATFVVRQRAYGTQYCGWVFNRCELLDAADDAGLELEREFIEGYSPHVVGAPEQFVHRAYLFTSR